MHMIVFLSCHFFLSVFVRRDLDFQQDIVQILDGDRLISIFT